MFVSSHNFQLSNDVTPQEIFFALSLPASEDVPLQGTSRVCRTVTLDSYPRKCFDNIEDSSTYYSKDINDDCFTLFFDYVAITVVFHIKSTLLIL